MSSESISSRRAKDERLETGRDTSQGRPHRPSQGPARPRPWHRRRGTLAELLSHLRRGPAHERVRPRPGPAPWTAPLRPHAPQPSWRRPPQAQPLARRDHAPSHATPPRLRRRVRAARPRRPQPGLRSGPRRGPAPLHVRPRPLAATLRPRRLASGAGRKGGRPARSSRPSAAAEGRGSRRRSCAHFLLSSAFLSPPAGARDPEASMETSQPGGRQQRGAGRRGPERALQACPAGGEGAGLALPVAARDAAPLGGTRGSL